MQAESEPLSESAMMRFKRQSANVSEVAITLPSARLVFQPSDGGSRLQYSKPTVPECSLFVDEFTTLNTMGGGKEDFLMNNDKARLQNRDGVKIIDTNMKLNSDRLHYKQSPNMKQKAAPSRNKYFAMQQTSPSSQGRHFLWTS